MSAPFQLIRGDNLGAMSAMADGSVDAVVTDPPYGIRFMGKAWDGKDIDRKAAARRAAPSADPHATDNGGHKSIAAEAGKYDLAPAAMRAYQEFCREWAAQCFRVLKPGGHLLSFASPRTYHRMVCGVEDAGFEIRDQILWLFGSGFPKSHNLEDDWDGWGTALKPAHEPIVVARKPLAKGLTVAANVLQFSTGALHIAACRVGEDVRVETHGSLAACSNDNLGGPGTAEARRGLPRTAKEYVGRWPANLIHDGSAEVVEAFPDAPGQKGDISTDPARRLGQNVYDGMARGRGGEASASSANNGAVGFNMKPGMRRTDSGSAARFFYCAKASPEDRHEGLTNPGPQFKQGSTLRDAENLGKDRKGNHHPTVKPTALMAYLCRLVTPPGGVVLDPFMGSGSTGKGAVREGFQFIGIELDEDEDGTPLGYMEISQARIEFELRRVRAQAAASVIQADLFNDLAA